VIRPGSLGWIAAHEFRLAWRDWQGMLTAGGRRSFPRSLAVLAIVALALHLPAWAIVARFGEDGVQPDLASLVSVTVIVILYFSLLLSQAMESVTRALYSRGDLDLVMSSPLPSRRLFSVRIAANAALVSLMSLVLSAPFIDVLVLSGGPRWLAAYGVAISFGVLAAALAVAITIGLFRLLGPRRTRLAAQVVAAVIGAAFAIGIQILAIINYGDFMQAGLVMNPGVIDMLPDETSLVWMPARAIFGDIAAMTLVAGGAFLVLAVVTTALAPRLGEHSIAATDLGVRRQATRRRRRFVIHSPRWAMRQKELLLLRRDPWLVSQTLTQLLYLIPPALLLSHNFGNKTGSMVVIVMVLVTVGGQLGGALAWLAISGEDAPDLVATAPLPANAVVRAKVEAVMGALALTLGPLVIIFGFFTPYHAVFAAIGITIAAASTLQIQMWFRAQARRSNFRRRHTSSRIATFAEAMTSFSWAAAVGLAAAGTWIAAISAVIALLIMAGARSLSPRKALLEATVRA
jgi:ABC-2 type transport system permease protein